MRYKSYSNIICPSPTEGATENIAESLAKKCFQCKISHTLKTIVFELLDNKKIGKLFSKYETIS